MLSYDLCERLKITYPIIQAPMAGGVTSSELVAAVSNAGCLGMIGAGYMNPKQLQNQIREIRSLTEKPFGVNLFVPSFYTNDLKKVQTANDIMQPFNVQFGLHEDLILPTYEQDVNAFYEQINIIIEENISVCSFTFGIPPTEIIDKLKDYSVVLMGTATTVQEAIINEQSGMDVVVVQGAEAGGHRGSFQSDEKQGLIGLMSLIPQTADAINIPVVAAGGIMDGRGVAAANILGASGVQMGTAFLVCEESGAHPLHKKAILAAHEDQVVLTKAFSGKMARGINNSFIEKLAPYENDLPAYPIQNELTKGIRKASSLRETTDCMSLWSGQSPRMAEKMTVSNLIKKIIFEVEMLGYKGGN